MNILPIIPNFQTKNSAQRNTLNNRTVIQPKLAQALNRDTVSFTGLKPAVIDTFGDIIENTYIANQKIYIGEIKKFQGALKRVTKKLADRGFSFDEEYNSKHPIKSLESYIDKCLRNGGASDKLRATVYWNNQNDIDGFKLFLNAMKAEGYEIAKIKHVDPLTLKSQTLPDLEIRQNNIQQEDLEPLGSFLSKAEISKPRSSTYSDYQMRFSPINRNDTLIELIMLYGPHYARAKELESKYVYNIARTFDRLHVNLKKNYPETSPGRRIVSNIDVIKTRLREDISKPLFTNAYNTEHKIKEPKTPIEISKVHCEVLNGYMSGIRQKIPMYYRDMKKEIKDDNIVIEFIKNSIEYKVRNDKTITPDEIKETRRRIKELIPKYEAEDIGVITTAQEMLKSTIARFGEK